MKFQVFELRKAKADKRAIFEWLWSQSEKGAESWLAEYDRAIDTLKQRADVFGMAPESTSCDEEIRHVLFKTRRGRRYRVLYMIRETAVHVLRVRGPGQASVDPGDLR